MLTLRAASATDAGRVRTSNQDRALVAERLIAVADGMGGHAGGEIAAQLALEGLAWSFDDARGDREGLVAAAQAANRTVFERAEREEALRGMGTTLTAAALVRSQGRLVLVLVNVGDSRAYLLDNGRVLRVTEDHSVVEQMVRQGELTPEEALVHPHRHILTRALGIDGGVDVDSFLLEARPGMRLLICSDGLTNELAEQEIADVLSRVNQREEAAQELVRRALAHGGSDNVTVVVADIEDDDEGHGAGSVAAAASAVPAEPPIAPPVRHALLRPIVQPRARARTAVARPVTHSRGERLVTTRVAVFMLVLLATLGGIIGFTIWFNRSTYYVGLDNGVVAIYEGRPGGFLWFKPTVVRTTQISESDVLDSNVSVLQQGVLESSYDAAQQVVNNLAAERSILGLPTVSGNTGTTTTAVTS